MKKGYSIVIFHILFLMVGGWVGAQYYYFDTGSTTYPYQQGCSETLLVRVNTQSHPYGPVAGLLRLRLDPAYFSYSTSSIASDLQTQLFLGSSETFSSWTSPSATPSWADAQKTLLQMDRNNGSVGYRGVSGLYGTLRFVPMYTAQAHSGIVSIVYDGDTIKTSLSYGGMNIIQSGQQNPRLTGTYAILQQPCLTDTTVPTIQISNPTHGVTKQRSLDGIHFSLLENGGVNGVTNVPYIFTGGNEWTGNVGGAISNQYGINLASLQITLSGNGQTRSFVGSSFSTTDSSSSLYAQPDQKTWQYLDKNYMVSLASAALFDYGIEKPITLNLSIRDRLGLQTIQSITFNQPQGPILIAGSRSPDAGAAFVKLDAPVVFGLQDDWAGVDSGSLRLRLQVVNASGVLVNTYLYSGSDFLFSGIVGQANELDWKVSLVTHPNFPPLSTVTVHIDGQDMAGNTATVSDYSFTTRPSCSQLQCCEDKQLQIKSSVSTLFATNLFVSGGNNPYFVQDVQTGYLYCGTESNGLEIYRGDESASVFVTYTDTPILRVLGNNIRAVLSGATLYLSKIFEYGSLSENKGGAGGGGGLSSLIKDVCPDGDFTSSYYDSQCGTSSAHGSATYCSVEKSEYSTEQVEAFQYAYEVGMTSMCPIDRADLKGKMLRKHLAKMLVEYGVRIMGIYPKLDKKGCANFKDMADESKEMQFYAKTVCQMELMGLDADGITPKENFDPNQEVDRAQFGTILSRMLFGYVNNLQSGEDQKYYYVHHLEALKKNSIIKNDDPRLKETRGFVMLMLKRAYDNGLVDYTYLSTSAKNGAAVVINL